MVKIRLSNRSAHRCPGFTLIELAIVVAIIAVLAAIAIPFLLGAKRGVEEKLVIAQMSQFREAQKTFKNDLNIGRFATLQELRTTKPGGNPLIEPGMVDENGDGLNYKGWIIGQLISPTATTYGVHLMPAEGNPAQYYFFMYEDGVIRKTALHGKPRRNTGTIVEE